MCSFEGRCQGECGSQKHTSMSASACSWGHPAISQPWSQVRERRSPSGRSAVSSIGQAYTDWASWPSGRSPRRRNRTAPLHHGDEGGPVERAHDQVAVPVIGEGPVGGLGRAGADGRDGPENVARYGFLAPVAGTAAEPARAQGGDQLALEGLPFPAGPHRPRSPPRSSAPPATSAMTTERSTATAAAPGWCRSSAVEHQHQPGARVDGTKWARGGSPAG